MSDYMYNIDGDTAEIYTNDDGTAAVFIDHGAPEMGESVFYYNDAETAVKTLRRMGFEF